MRTHVLLAGTAAQTAHVFSILVNDSLRVKKKSWPKPVGGKLRLRHLVNGWKGGFINAAIYWIDKDKESVRSEATTDQNEVPSTPLAATQLQTPHWMQ